MAVWLQRKLDGGASPVRPKRLGLVLLGHRTVENLEPLLCPPIPAVDGVIAPRHCDARGLTLPVTRVRKEVGEQDLVLGRWDGPCSEYEHLLWLRAGESLLVGDVATLRQTAQQAHGACLLPVHSPLRATLPLTLLGLEPRWVSASKPAITNPGFLGLPIERDAAIPPEPPSPREDLAWVLLYRANRAFASGDLRAGFALLDHLYRHTAERTPTIAGVAVRNGLAAAIAIGDRRLLNGWSARGYRFSGYKEVQLLQALIPCMDGDAQGTVDQLTRLIEREERQSPTSWISGGGEASYRALTFRGIAHDRTGAECKALTDWAAALRANPSYLPPLQMLVRRRLHLAVLEELGLRWHLPGRSKAVQVLIGTAYAQSSDPSVITELVQETTSPSVQRELRQMARHPQPGQQTKGSSSIHWEGAFFTMSSLGRVNRELASRLLARKWPLAAIPTEPSSCIPGEAESERLLADHVWRDFPEPSITVRHCWPPFLRSVRSGKVVIYLPWEFGPIPREWVDPLRRVDEVWVYSEWVRQGVIRSGIEPERVVVIPCGVDPAIYHPSEASAATRYGDFRFLYVGGTILRKGYDLALEAFLAEFGPDEDVTLIVKEFGSETSYRGMNGTEVIRAAAAATADLQRRVAVLDRLLSDEELADLYRSADCLVAPYRAEGFCMPALEAMACGTPAILPACGPALDYAGPETSLMVKADQRVAGDRVDHLRLSGEATLCQVSMAELCRAMRWAFTNRDELGSIGRRAALDVAARFTWNHACDRAEQRLHRLLETGPVRDRSGERRTDRRE